MQESGRLLLAPTMRPFVQWTVETLDEDNAYASTGVVYNLPPHSYFLRCREPDDRLVRCGMEERVEELRSMERLAKERGDTFPAPGHLGGLPLLIDAALGFPEIDATSFTRAPDSTICNLFVKTLQPFVYGDPLAREDYKRYLLSEARVYQVLLQHPHPHIVKYHGCVVKGDQLVGLALDALEQDLEDRCRQPIFLDVERVVKEVRGALSHLHGLGYCHNDVNPRNIMLTTGDKAVLVDFDSCVREGEDLDKWPLTGYKHPESTKSCQSNDWYGLNEVEKVLRKAFENMPHGTFQPACPRTL